MSATIHAVTDTIRRGSVRDTASDEARLATPSRTATGARMRSDAPAASKSAPKNRRQTCSARAANTAPIGISSTIPSLTERPKTSPTVGGVSRSR